MVSQSRSPKYTIQGLMPKLGEYNPQSDRVFLKKASKKWTPSQIKMIKDLMDSFDDDEDEVNSIDSEVCKRTFVDYKKKKRSLETAEAQYKELMDQ